MWKHYAWIAVATLAPLCLLAVLPAFPGMKSPPAAASSAQPAPAQGSGPQASATDNVTGKDEGTAANMTASDLAGTTWEISPTSYGPVQIQLLANGRANVSAPNVNLSTGGSWLIKDNQLFACLDGTDQKAVQANIQGNTLVAPNVTIRRIRPPGAIPPNKP